MVGQVAAEATVAKAAEAAAAQTEVAGCPERRVCVGEVVVVPTPGLFLARRVAISAREARGEASMVARWAKTEGCTGLRRY